MQRGEGDPIEFNGILKDWKLIPQQRLLPTPNYGREQSKCKVALKATVQITH